MVIDASSTAELKAGAHLQDPGRNGGDQLMGMPAARVGDTTSHGTPLSPGPGAATVRIGGQPAWRAGHRFPHLPAGDCARYRTSGGRSRLRIGSTSVRIEGAFAARQGDQVIESGPPNAIAVGLPTVKIG